MPQDLDREAESGVALSLSRSDIRRAKRVYTRHKGAVDRLLAQCSAFGAGCRQNDFFTGAVLECFARHFLNNPSYRRLCLNHGIQPGNIRKYADLGSLPYITAHSGNLEDILPTAAASAIKLRCRQTLGGQSFDIPLEARSLRRLRRAADNIGRACGLHSREKVNYLFLTSSDGPQNDAWEMWRKTGAARLTKTGSCRTVSAWDAECSRIFEQYLSEGSAWRIIGSAEQIMQSAASVPISAADFQAVRRSYILVYTSWEEYNRLPRTEIAQNFGISPGSVRAVCTAPLQLIPFCACEAGRLHVPVYSRIIVRCPQSLQPQTPDRTGLLQFITPCLSACASFSVLTEYKGRLETDCPCGRRAPVLIVEE